MLIIQRAVEDEFDAWLGRALRAPARLSEAVAQLSGRVAQRLSPQEGQTGEGEFEVAIPQAREAAEPFVSKLFPRGTKLLRAEPLKARASLCAREDSNLHGELSPQGHQPDRGGVDGFRGVQIVQFARFSGPAGRIRKGGCCHGVATDRGAAPM